MSVVESIQIASPVKARSARVSELPPVVDFGGLPLCPVTRDELLDGMISRATAGRPTNVHYLNAHVFNLARDDASFFGSLAAADLLYADGMSVVLAARAFGYSVPPRLTAADYFVDFARRCADRDVSIYLLGGASGVAATTADRLQHEAPGLDIAGVSPGYFPADESNRLIERINASGAGVLVVGMGSPVQENWVRRHSRELTVPVRWTVGALFDYFAGQEPRAPQWLCRLGGEWLFRLLARPSQRWHRYLVGNPRFVAWVAKAYLLRRGGKVAWGS